jgi:hypothetical protein
MLYSAIGLIGSGASIVALVSLSFIPDEFKKFFLVFGALTAFIGFVMLVLWKVGLVSKGAQFLIDKVSAKATEFFDYEYDVISGQSKCLKELCRIGHKLIGDNHIDEETLKLRLSKNNRIVKIIKSLRNNKKGISGYYIAYPISKDADNLLQKKFIRNGKEIRDEQILTDFSRAHAIYISMVAGRNIHSKAFSLYVLRKDLTEYIEKYRKIKKLYAKPSTKDGLRILTKYGFEPLGDGTEVWSYNINR